MKALYTLLTHLGGRFSELKTGLALILVFVGVKLMVPITLSAGPSVAAAALLLAGTGAYAMLAARRRRREPVTRD
jgi:predicted tellurium resistance membrane protein TerC